MSRFHDRINRTIWAGVRNKARERDNFRCVQCGKAGRLEVDHIQPLGEGGAYYDLTNLQTLCREDHFRKTAKERASQAPKVRKIPHQGWSNLVEELN